MAKRTSRNLEVLPSSPPPGVEAKPLLSPNDALSQIEEWISSERPDYSSLKAPVRAIKAVELLEERLNKLRCIQEMDPTANIGWKLEIKSLLIRLYGEGSAVIEEVMKPNIGLRIYDNTPENQTDICEREIPKQIGVLERLIAEQKDKGTLRKRQKKERASTLTHRHAVIRIDGKTIYWFENKLILTPNQTTILKILCTKPEAPRKRSYIMKKLQMAEDSKDSFKSQIAKIREAMRNASKGLSKGDNKRANTLIEILIETRTNKQKDPHIVLHLDEKKILR